MSRADADLLRQFNEDRALACSVLFSHRHTEESPPAHVEIMDLWACADEFVVIEAAREFGKSTLSEEWLTLAGAYGNFHYWLLLGETYSKACQRLAAIDYEARTNIKLQNMFGGPILARKSIENKVWFRSGALIEAIGWEQELQSFKETAFRPDGAWLDDVENKERVRDKEAVDASMRKLYLELLPALDKLTRKVRITQTRRAEDCMVVRLAANDEWLYRAFPICDGEPEDPLTRSNWPQRYPMSWIRHEKQSYQQAGMLSEFLQSYMLQAVDRSSKPFREDQLGSLDLSPYHWMPRIAIYDPSRSTRERRTGSQAKSDRTGKVVVSRMGSKILVHESSGHYWKPNELVDDLFLTMQQHSPAKIGIEQNSLNQWLAQPIRIEMLRRGELLPLQLLQAPQDRSKEDFIMGLQPFAEANDIVLVGGRSAHPQLVAEWSNFPSGPRDVLNALAYALRMFGGIPVYEDFSAANIAEAPVPRRGEEVFIGANASPNEVVAVAVVRDGRRLQVARDWALTGALTETVRTLAFEIRTTFPNAAIQVWVPADTYEQWQRVPLVPSLRAERLTPYRAEHVAVARGSLSERLRTPWRGARLLTVDRDARGTLNALGAAYCLPAEKGGRTAQEPEAGPARLLAEALECMVAMLDRSEQTAAGFPKGAHIDRTPGGVPFISSNPRAGLRT